MELKMVGTGTHKAEDAIFGRDFNEALVHQLVVAYQANARLFYPEPALPEVDWAALRADCKKEG